MDWMRKNQIIWKKIGILMGVYLGIKYLLPLVIPFFVAGLTVYGCWPLLCRVRRRFHIRPAFTMAVFLLLAGGLLAAGLYAAGHKAGNSFLEWCAKGSAAQQLERVLYDCCDTAGELLHVETEGLRIFVTEQLEVFQDQAQQKVLGAVGSSWQAIKKAGAFLTAVLVTLVSILLLSSDFEKIREAGRTLPFAEQAVQLLHRIGHSAGGYLKAQGMIMGIVMLICTAGIWLMGRSSVQVRNPVLTGIATGFLDALPVFGTGTVFLPWILIKMIQREYLAAVILAGTYGACTLTRELLEPKLIGDKLGFLPIVILMSVYAGVKLYGLGGILLGPLSLLLVKEFWRMVDENGQKEKNGA